MKKVIFLSLLSFLFIESSLATMILGSEEFSQSNLRYRGKGPQTAYFPLVARDSESQKKITAVITEKVVDENEVFSNLGKVWEEFKNQNFEACYPPIFSLQIQKKPEALYLMGVMYENGYNGFRQHLGQTIEWYTLALAYSEENTPLRGLALKALERCKSEALKKAKMPFSY